MKNFVLAFGILLVFSITSCTKDLTSCIELDKSSVPVGQSIVFTSCSENALSYQWSIVGPALAPENTKGWSDRVITVPFSVAGSYTITLKSYPKFSFLGTPETSTATFTVN